MQAQVPVYPEDGTLHTLADWADGNGETKFKAQCFAGNTTSHKMALPDSRTGVFAENPKVDLNARADPASPADYYYKRGGRCVDQYGAVCNGRVAAHAFYYIFAKCK